MYINTFFSIGHVELGVSVSVCEPCDLQRPVVAAAAAAVFTMDTSTDFPVDDPRERPLPSEGENNIEYKNIAV